MSWGVYDYPEPPGEPENIPHCIICGKECGTIYRNRDFEVVGCEECITAYDAWEDDYE